MSPILTVVLVLVAAAVAGALGFYLGGENRKRTAEAKIGSAEEEAKARWMSLTRRCCLITRTVAR